MKKVKPMQSAEEVAALTWELTASQGLYEKMLGAVYEAISDSVYGTSAVFELSYDENHDTYRGHGTRILKAVADTLENKGFVVSNFCGSGARETLIVKWGHVVPKTLSTGPYR